jgi:hypothetical protein
MGGGAIAMLMVATAWADTTPWSRLETEAASSHVGTKVLTEGPYADEAIRRWSESIKGLLAECRESPVWLKTPDGRTVFYTWCPDGLAGSVTRHTEVRGNHELISDTAVADRRLPDACGIRLTYFARRLRHAGMLYFKMNGLCFGMRIVL